MKINKEALLEAIKNTPKESIETSYERTEPVLSISTLLDLIDNIPAVEGAAVATNKYYIGQRVLINDSVIGKVVVSETGRTNFGIWVFNPANGYASDYSFTSIKPLPNGQL